MALGSTAATVATPPPPPPPKDSRNLSCLLATSLVSILFVLSFTSTSTSTTTSIPLSSSSSSSHSPPPPPPTFHFSSSLPPPPSLAYLITGSAGDCDRVLRLLSAAYHPKNLYLLHLNLDAQQEERHRLAAAVQAVPVFKSVGNVHVVGDAGNANQKGSSALAVVLHGAAVLLRLERGWDWFVNLEASHYPLITQDGSASVIVSRKFIEFCILGTDNLPRALLLYYANTPSSHANYFHTVLCNSREFNKTIYNGNLHFVSWDESHKHDPHVLGVADFYNMTQSGAAFGSRFSRNDPVLDRIDQELLNRLLGKITPGGWCLGSDDPCTVWGDANILRPSTGAKRLEKMIEQFLSSGAFHSHQCTSE